MSSTKGGEGLFMQSNGKPMVFHLPPGPTKKMLAPIIKRHGGEVTSRCLNNVIRLADEKLWTSRQLLSSSDCYWPTYVVDCVKQSTLLDMEKYKCSKGRRLMRKITVEDEQTADEYDFDFGDTDRPVVRNKKGRMHYTKAEDMNILRYLMENQEYRRARGIAVWKAMEKLQVTPHPAQSMMTRFRKVILSQLERYNIPNNWKTCLTGDIARFVHATESTSGREDGAKRVSESEEVMGDDECAQPSTSTAGPQTGMLTEEDRGTSDKGSTETEVEEAGDSFDQQLLQMAQDNRQEAEDDGQTCAVVSAGELDVNGDQPSGSTAEGLVNDTEHLPVRKRQHGRVQEEHEGEGERLTVRSPAKSLPKKPQQREMRVLRSLHTDARGSASPVRDKATDELRRTENSSGSPAPQVRERSASSPDHDPAAEDCSAAGTPNTSSTLLCPVTPPICGKSLQQLSSFSQTRSIASTCAEKERIRRLERGKSRVLTALGAIRALSEEFGLSLREARSLLRRNSGHVHATRYWIMTGHTLPGHHYWRREDDEVLRTCFPDHPDWQTLEGMHGLMPVLQRIQWLQAVD